MSSQARSELAEYPVEQVGCQCPIHRDGGPGTIPFGYEFSHRVEAVPIDRETAGEIYEAHHSYMPSVPNVNLAHHGITFDGELVGAISYRYPLLSRLKLYLEDGCYHRDDSRGTDESKEILYGDRIIEVNRICVGVPFRNLASCALSTSQETFVSETDEDFDFLLTFIRNDHVGSMLKALIDKGWQLTGMSEPRQAGNREDKDIRTWAKQRWLCSVSDIETIRSNAQ